MAKKDFTDVNEIRIWHEIVLNYVFPCAPGDPWRILCGLLCPLRNHTLRRTAFTSWVVPSCSRPVHPSFLCASLIPEFPSFLSCLYCSAISSENIWEEENVTLSYSGNKDPPPTRIHKSPGKELGTGIQGISPKGQHFPPKRNSGVSH